MKSIPIHEMYDIQRLKPSHWSKYALLVLYAPAGILLALFRMWCCFIFAWTKLFIKSPSLKKRLDLILISLLGVSVKLNHLENLNLNKNSILVANHLLLGDFFPYWKLEQNLVILCPKTTNIFWKGTWSIMDKIFINPGINGLKKLYKDVSILLESPEPKSLLVFPEGTIGNGKALHRFNKFAFSFNTPIQPVYVKVRYFFPLNLHPIKGYHLANIFFSFFHPRLEYTLNFLPCQERRAGERSEEFAQRIQYLLANSYDLIPTEYGRVDKEKFRKTV